MLRQNANAGVLNLFCLIYPLPNENAIIYPNFLTWAPGGFFRPKTGDLQKKKKDLHQKFKGFYGQKLVISSWASKIWRNDNPVQHYQFFITDN